jgi:hypothetical protein
MAVFWCSVRGPPQLAADWFLAPTHGLKGSCRVARHPGFRSQLCRRNPGSHVYWFRRNETSGRTAGMVARTLAI